MSKTLTKRALRNSREIRERVVEKHESSLNSSFGSDKLAEGSMSSLMLESMSAAVNLCKSLSMAAKLDETLAQARAQNDSPVLARLHLKLQLRFVAPMFLTWARLNGFPTEVSGEEVDSVSLRALAKLPGAEEAWACAQDPAPSVFPWSSDDRVVDALRQAADPDDVMQVVRWSRRQEFRGGMLDVYLSAVSITRAIRAQRDYLVEALQGLEVIGQTPDYEGRLSAKRAGRFSALREELSALKEGVTGSGAQAGSGTLASTG